MISVFLSYRMTAYRRRLSCILSLAARVGSAVLFSPALHASAPLAPLAAVDAKWHYYASPHFELYSHNPENASREVLHNLEILRAVFIERLNLEIRLEVPVTVYYFRSEKEFQAYAPKIFSNQS